MLLFLYPTTTTFIDDDQNFLNAVTTQPSIGQSVAFYNPNNAIDELTKANAFDRMKKHIRRKDLAHNQGDLVDAASLIGFDPSHLYEEIYNPNRFRDIAVIVVDYYMDGLHGIEVCQKLKELPAKKILLTGGYDKEHLAIKAFNEGLIDKFISKTDPDLSRQLSQAIKILTESYFNDIGKMLIPLSLEATHIFNNHNYINFVRSQQLNLNSVEFYLLDASGSCLFLDIDGAPSWLIIKHQDELENYKNIAIDQEAPASLIAELTNKSQIPFFFKDEDYQAGPENWGNYFLPARPLPGIAGYFYSIHTGNIRNIVDKQRIASFNSIIKKEPAIAL